MFTNPEHLMKIGLVDPEISLLQATVEKEKEEEKKESNSSRT